MCSLAQDSPKCFKVLSKPLLKMSGLILCGVLFIGGCGYTTTGSTLASRFKTIHVSPVVNKIKFTSEDRRDIYLPLLEVDIRNDVIDEFIVDGNLRVVESDMADLQLDIELVKYHRRSIRFTDNDDTEEYRIFIVVDMTLYDQQKDEVMWQVKTFTGDATYFVTGPNASSEDGAIDEAVEDLADRMVERVVQHW